VRPSLAIIKDLQSKFEKTWPPEHFKALPKEHFEEYYPPTFESRVKEVLSMSHGPEKQKAKGKLAEEVVIWASANTKRAAESFVMCAKDVLELLSEINKKLVG
jgi:hypothetical protein